MPRAIRRLIVLAGLALALAAWRNRMMAANEAASGRIAARGKK